MGLLGSILKAGFEALVNANNHAENIRYGSSGMTDNELKRNFADSVRRGDFISAEGYKRAYNDNKNR